MYGGVKSRGGLNYRGWVGGLKNRGGRGGVDGVVGYQW